MNNKSYFFLTTNGHTASKWIAGVLSKHPDIICSHGAASLDYSTKHHSEYTEKEMILQMKEEWRKDNPIDSLLEEIEVRFPNKKIIGNVHLFNLRQFNNNLEKNKSQKFPVVIDIVRHPISFVQSGFYNILRQCEFNPERIKYLYDIRELNKNLFEKYSSKYELDLNDLKILSFMANIMTMKSFQINFSLHQYSQRFKMEDLTSNKESLIALIKLISANSIEITENYLSEVFKSKKSNSHDLNKIERTEKDKYNNWEVWQKEMFKELLNLTNCKNYFEQMGYDLSFVN